MGSSPSAPAPPDPVKTAAAQTESNRATAITQTGLNSINQSTPQGSLSYSQIGTWPDGTPRFQSTQSYSPGEQAIYDTDTKTRQNLANIGTAQSAKIGTLLDTPFNINAARDNKISQIQRGFLDPQWSGLKEALDTQSINKGIRPGSEGWKTAQADFSDNRQKAYDRSYLDAYDTAEKSALTERNQPINEITALMSGSQVSQPNYNTTPQSAVAPTDIAGITQAGYQNSLVPYNAAISQGNANRTGMYGLGSAAVMGGMMFL